MGKNVAYEKSKKFAVRIVKLYQFLCDEKKEFVMSKQILRSGTSIGANLAESVYSSSTADFISKLTISLKECSETAYWLDLLRDTDYISEKQFTSLSTDCNEISKIITAILKTTKIK